MKPEIKQRIEQIKNGIIPEGYKKTKVGMIPVEWEIKKLSDVLHKQTQKNTENLIHNVLTNSALQGIISQSEYFDKQIANDDNTNGYYIVRQGYFVYNPRISMNAPCGPFNKYYSKEDGVMSPLYTVYKYIDQSPYYSDYLAYFFMSANWYGYMNSIANYGARSDRMNITSEDMNRMPLPYPPLHEQEKIAKILQTQDKVIDLQQNKIEEYKRLKRIMLQKMFPKKGCKVPEFRFKGFTDDWEQRKFSDFAQRESAVEVSSSDCPSVEYEDVIAEEGRLNKDIKQKETQKTGIKFDGTQVLYGKLRPYLHNWLNPDFMGVAVGDWWVLRPICIDKDYLYRLIQTKRFDDVANQSAGSKMPRADWNLISNTKFFVPISTEEQNKIAKAFTNLDRLITLHQRKLNEYKKYKKALMQLLLTGIVRCK